VVVARSVLTRSWCDRCIICYCFPVL